MKIRGSSPATQAPDASSGANGAAGSFADTVKDAVKALEATQVEADQEAAALGAGAGNLHEAALALEKADVAMRLGVKVRNKVVEAYQDVMRMSV
jgi:flagellar hook-basal body complex protein FliE